MSLATDIADGVVAELNGATEGTFSQSFTAERKVIPRMKIQDLADLMDDGELAVTVVPKNVTIETLSRSSSKRDHAVDIGIQAKLPTHADPDEAVADYGTLADEIVAYLVRRRLASVSTVYWHSLTQDPVFDPEHLDNFRVFTTVLTATYRGVL